MVATSNRHRKHCGMLADGTINFYKMIRMNDHFQNILHRNVRNSCYFDIVFTFQDRGGYQIKSEMHTKDVYKSLKLALFLPLCLSISLGKKLMR